MALAIPLEPAFRGHLRVRPPFRLDLTVAALRRLPTNRVDLFDGERYLRAFSTPSGPVVWEVREEGRGLFVALYGAVEDAAPHLRRVERMLGTDVDLDPSRLLGHLGPYRGMLYYHLLLAHGAGG